MISLLPSSLPPLPLLLWETPPGLELILRQEGVAFARVRDPHPLVFQRGRFVLYDGRRVSLSKVRAMLSPDHVALDIDGLRQGERIDPFEAIVDTRAVLTTWSVDGYALTERVARHDKARIRRGLLHRLRQAVAQAGGVWARLAAYPFPYRSALNFRVDLDETNLEDYARFARARRPLADCCTHFVSTHAYGEHPEVLRDLLRFDTQSHGHYHVIYRDPELNRRNLERAHRVLEESGFDPVGFAAPHGRWNAGLDVAIERLGYLFSSDFQLGYDDLPFFPWRDGRFSNVLQVPIHPICEGLFLEAGASQGATIARHLVQVTRAKIEAGEPAFVYGHPEGRLARFPEILAALASEVADRPLLWRVSLSEFARWWRWRNEREWSLVPRGEGRYEVQFDDWDSAYPLGLEIHRGAHVSTIPVRSSRMALRLDDLAYERQDIRVDPPAPIPAPRKRGLRSVVRQAIDWETVTPIDELPSDSLSARVKKGLRRWRQGPTRGREEAPK